MNVKICKLIDDPCYGKSYNQIEQCDFCWIKKACSVKWKNRKD